MVGRPAASPVLTPHEFSAVGHALFGQIWQRELARALGRSDRSIRQLAIGAGRLLSAELYGVTNWDPMALLLAVFALSACTFIAAVVPARRAASISPTSALRAE